MRRRAGLALPQRGPGRLLGAGPRPQQPRARGGVAARGRGALPAHDPPGRRAGPHRHLDRRALPQRGRGRDLRRLERGRRRRLRARPLSGLRTVRPQDRTPPGRARPAVHAEPRRVGRVGGARRPATGHRGPAQRRLRPHLALDREGPALRLRLSHRRPPPRSRHRVRGAPGAHDPHLPWRAPAVWRSENGGGSWRRLAKGLPKKESFFTVQRDAMDVDELRSPALYLGTTTGQLWIGRDGRRGVGLPVRFAAPHPLRQGRGGVIADESRVAEWADQNPTSTGSPQAVPLAEPLRVPTVKATRRSTAQRPAPSGDW